MSPVVQGLITVVLGVGGCLAYFYFSNQFLVWAFGRAADRPDRMGKHRQIDDLYADGNFICRGGCDFQTDL